MTFSLKIVSFLVLLFTAACTPSDSPHNASTESAQCILDEQDVGRFVAVPSGVFTKAKQAVYREEGVAQKLSVAGFEIQVHEVTNQQFAKFVTATGYVTDAERDKSTAAGSALFTVQSDPAAGSAEGGGSWSLSQHATWRHPEGLGSTIDGKDHYPVVHVSNNDAQQYATWVGGRLPTEIEWEYVAQRGLPDARVQNSGAFDEQGAPIANTWQGLFPLLDSGEDGFAGIAPVGCFAANQLGVFDMIGNVWEWTSTEYATGNHTIKGGSFLCAPNYCRRYRPAARQPHESDFSTNHIGFRVVRPIR